MALRSTGIQDKLLKVKDFKKNKSPLSASYWKNKDSRNKHNTNKRLPLSILGFVDSRLSFSAHL